MKPFIENHPLIRKFWLHIILTLISFVCYPLLFYTYYVSHFGEAGELFRFLLFFTPIIYVINILIQIFQVTNFCKYKSTLIQRKVFTLLFINLISGFLVNFLIPLHFILPVYNFSENIMFSTEIDIIINSYPFYFFLLSFIIIVVKGILPRDSWFIKTRAP